MFLDSNFFFFGESAAECEYAANFTDVFSTIQLLSPLTQVYKYLCSAVEVYFLMFIFMIYFIYIFPHGLYVA